MLYPAMSELLKNVDSRYLLVNVVAHRARQLSIESELTHEPTINTDTEPNSGAGQPPAPVLLNTAEELNFMKICVKSVCTSPLGCRGRCPH